MADRNEAENPSACEESMEQENNGEEHDSESESDSSEDEELTEQAITELENQIRSSPYQYDLHTQLITLLRKEGELEKLRNARQQMSQCFPLTGELWLAWIQDELKVLSEDGDKSQITELFDRAVKDYTSPDVWLEYAQYCIGGIGTPDGIAQARGVFERAITAIGLHASKGSAVWEIYREFENALLATMQPPLGAIVTDEKEKELKAQTDRISTIFKRQLALPLLDMEQTHEEYEQWLSEPAPGYVKHSYQKALARLEKIIPFEDKLSAASTPRLSAYQSYIDYELSDGDPARIQCIYERALNENCLVSDLWANYAAYLDNQLKTKHVVLPVYDRAVRNCPWSLTLWQGCLRAKERYEESHTAVKETFEKALLGGFTQGADYLQLWQTYLDYLRRRINWESEHTEELHEFRISMERAIDYLTQYFGIEADPTCSLQQFWARIEAKPCKNMAKARVIWNGIMGAGFGKQAQMWLEYYNLERSYGDSKHCRKVLQKAVNTASDWPESVCDALLNFEREEGTLETWEAAVKRVDAQMKRVNEQRQKVAVKEAEYNRHTEERGDHKRQGRGEKRGSKKADGKGEMQDMLSRRLQNAKKRKLEDHGQPKKGDAQSKSDFFKVPFVPATKTGSSPAKKPKVEDPQIEPVPMEQHDTTEASVEKDTQDKSIQGESTQEAKKKDDKPSHDASKDPVTVFVKNLPYNLTEERIRKIFHECGEITEVRMVANYQKQFKGYCYVEFKNKESVEKALKLDKQPVDGRPMYVDPSRDTQKTPAPKKFQFSNNMEKNKLFVSGLPRSAGKDELQKLFGEYGELKDIRIVTYKNGTPKGLAFVEFTKEADASRAVMGADGTQMGEHTVNVAISNPPKRKDPKEEAMDTSRPPPISLGAKGVTGPRGKGRTQLSMVPRALKRQPAPSAANKPSQTGKETDSSKEKSAAEKDASGDTKPKQMTNADFAKMMLKR